MFVFPARPRPVADTGVGIGHFRNTTMKMGEWLGHCPTALIQHTRSVGSAKFFPPFLKSSTRSLSIAGDGRSDLSFLRLVSIVIAVQFAVDTEYQAPDDHMSRYCWSSQYLNPRFIDVMPIVSKARQSK
jgi:hypothetical protein